MKLRTIKRKAQAAMAAGVVVELRAAAHEFTVQADRIAAGHSLREDGDG